VGQYVALGLDILALSFLRLPNTQYLHQLRNKDKLAKVEEMCKRGVQGYGETIIYRHAGRSKLEVIT
jgi:hypothetical protein